MNKNSITAIAIDDDPIALKMIVHLSSKSPDVNLVDTFENGLLGIEYLQENKVDLIFLDLNMPELSGWEVLELLDERPKIIITTSRRDEAIKGFDFQVDDFIEKPIPVKRFLKAIEHIKKKSVNNEQQSSIFFRIDKEYKRVNPEEITHVEAMGDYVKIHEGSDKSVVHSPLIQLKNILGDENFMQCHRSFLVNVHKIVGVNSDEIRLSNNKSIPVSRKLYKAVLNRLKVH